MFPFAVYDDHTPVGFMMLDTDDDGSLDLWRIMFPEEHCNKGYGTAAIELLCTLMKGKSFRWAFLPPMSVHVMFTRNLLLQVKSSTVRKPWYGNCRGGIYAARSCLVHT